MFFSSPLYTDPDIVVVYGNSHEMLDNEDCDIHSEISYRNMTNSRDMVLVLTDATEDLVKQGVKAVNAVQPVDQLVLPMKNKLRGWGSNRDITDKEGDDVNDRYYFVCLRRR